MNRCRCFDNGFQVGGQKDICKLLTNGSCINKNKGLYYCMDANFNHCDIDDTGTNLNNANLDNASFDYADLSTVSLVDASLHGANFNYSTLIGTNFQGADLTNTNFIGSRLDNAIFNGAILDSAMFESAYVKNKLVLNGVDFTDTHFKDTIFNNVIFGEDVKLGDNIIGSPCGNVEFLGELDNKYKCDKKIIKK
tara:strand:+ start:1068 stop:1649 length:582 start_codon:yes stop_codon:yes gene_type:complete